MSFISIYGYAALFIAALVEGPMASVIGAFLASRGLLDLGGVYLISVLGDMGGDMILYGVGRSSRLARAFLRKRLDVAEHHRLLSLWQGFQTHPGRVLVTAKLTHAAGFLVLLSAGAARIPLKVFLGFNFLATLPKSAVFVLLGYFAGAAYNHIDFYLWLFSCGVILALVIGCLYYARRVVKLEPPKG